MRLLGSSVACLPFSRRGTALTRPRVIRTRRRHGVEHPFQGTIAISDGQSLWAFRYSSEGKSRSLFFTRDVRLLRQQYPDREILREVSDDARLVGVRSGAGGSPSCSQWARCCAPPVRVPGKPLSGGRVGLAHRSRL